MRLSTTMSSSMGWTISNPKRQYPSRLSNRTNAGSSASHDPDRRHDDDDGDELQQHAQPHQLLRAVRRAAAHHVDEAEDQDDRDGADGDRNGIMRHEIHDRSLDALWLASVN